MIETYSAYDMSVSIDPSLNLADEKISRFCNQLKEWAGKAYCVGGRGVSLKIRGDNLGKPHASLWWNGKSLTTIEFRYPETVPPRFEPYWFGQTDKDGNKWIKFTEADVWDELLKPRLLALIAEERKRLEEIETAINEASDWHVIKPWR